MTRRARGLPRAKSIFDPVHGTITLSGTPLRLVGHPWFQRLWGIRQTGFAHLVFPGANHTRLEHSLGVYHVASSMAARLGVVPRDREVVGIGALLHDLGHGPFSHTLEPVMREVLGVGHESLSRLRITSTGTAPGPVPGPSAREILENDGFSPERIADLVDPLRRAPGEMLLRAVLHGATDADRIDYLQRDAHYTGVAHGAIDAVRLLDTVRSAGGRLAFAAKGRAALEGFLVGRSLMYSSVYYHKTVRAAEVMAQAAVALVPGFPESVRGLFESTDAEAVTTLRAAGGRSADLAAALLYRRLHKRLLTIHFSDPGSRSPWERLKGSPKRRREVERSTAERLSLPQGAVLFDLAGLEASDRESTEWGNVRILDGARTERPFTRTGPWKALLSRRTVPYDVGVYVDWERRNIEPRRVLSAIRASI